MKLTSWISFLVILVVLCFNLLVLLIPMYQPINITKQLLVQIPFITINQWLFPLLLLPLTVIVDNVTMRRFILPTGLLLATALCGMVFSHTIGPIIICWGMINFSFVAIVLALIRYLRSYFSIESFLKLLFASIAMIILLYTKSFAIVDLSLTILSSWQQVFVTTAIIIVILIAVLWFTIDSAGCTRLSSVNQKAYQNYGNYLRQALSQKTNKIFLLCVVLALSSWFNWVHGYLSGVIQSIWRVTAGDARDVVMNVYIGFAIGSLLFVFLRSWLGPIRVWLTISLVISLVCLITILYLPINLQHALYLIVFMAFSMSALVMTVIEFTWTIPANIITTWLAMTVAMIIFIAHLQAQCIDKILMRYANPWQIAGLIPYVNHDAYQAGLQLLCWFLVASIMVLYFLPEGYTQSV